MINVKKRIVKIDELSRAVAHMQRQFIDKDSDENVVSLPTPELNEIVYEGERIALSCRQAIEEKGYEDSDEITVESSIIRKTNIPVDVQYINGILRVQTPLTLRRMFHEESLKGNYLLMNYVEIALQEYIEKNGPLFDKVEAPLVAIVKRTSNSYSKNNICDNDNIENGRIINTIMSALGYSDNPLMMDIYSCFRICKNVEEAKMEFIFTSYDKFKLIINELDRVV